MSGIPAFLIPHDLSNCWSLPLLEAGFEVNAQNRLEESHGKSIINYGGIIRRDNFITNLSIFSGADKNGHIVDASQFFATLYPIGMLKTNQAWAKEVSRLLVASGAKSFVSPYGFKHIFTCNGEMLQSLPFYLQADKVVVTKDTSRICALNGGRWVASRTHTRVEVVWGFGLDCSDQKPIPYISLDCRLLYTWGKEKLNTLINDLLQRLVEAGAKRLEAVIPWPSPQIQKS